MQRDSIKRESSSLPINKAFIKGCAALNEASSVGGAVILFGLVNVLGASERNYERH